MGALESVAAIVRDDRLSSIVSVPWRPWDRHRCRIAFFLASHVFRSQIGLRELGQNDVTSVATQEKKAWFVTRRDASDMSNLTTPMH